VLYEKKQVLITVKAYPNPSKEYGETVCCAGIDLKTGQWIRLYPIPYRYLDSDKKFKKYGVVEVSCKTNTNDKRPESYKVDCDSIKLIEWLDTKKGGWERRKSVVMPTQSKSMCSVYEGEMKSLKSLALIKPSNINFSWKKATVKSENNREKYYAQLSLFYKRKEAIKAIPYNFYYEFICDGEINCPGHKLLIIDWEIGQAYLSWEYEQPILLEKIKEKWLNLMCSKKRDTYFYVGNMQRFKQTFMVLGTFYPPF